MEKISAPQLFELFLQTLDYCGMFLLECETQDVEYYLFEEFDSDSISFLHQDSLDRLLDGGYISAEIYSMCLLLHKKFRNLEGASLWNAEAVRSAPEWYDILSLADRIKSLVNID